MRYPGAFVVENLLKEAEGQEWSDAMLNAAQMRKAAARAGASREQLESNLVPAG